MGVRRLSEITPAGVMPSLTDQVVGVTTGTVDNLFTLQQIKTVVGGGGSGTPGGANTDVQFNNSGSLGGDSGFTYAGSGGVITVTPAANTNPFLITGGSTTGAGVGVVGPKVIGTLNTTGVVDGAAFFANITNTASGVGTTLFDLQVNGTSVLNFDMLGNIFMTGDRAISSSTGLTIEQTGDNFGPTGFFLANRSGQNGAVFEQLGTVSVVDFIFLINGSGGFNGQANFRYERRTTFLIFPTAQPFGGAGSNTQEFQQGIGWDKVTASKHPWFVVGDAQSGCFQNQALASFCIAGSGLAGGTTCTASQFAFAVDTGAFSLAWREESTSGNFLNSANSGYEMQLVQLPSPAIFAFGDVQHYTKKPIRYATATTGAGSALLGANCPAVTVTAPYTWITAGAPDGSTVYIPAWK